MNGLPSVCFGVLIFMPRGLGLTKEDINKRISHRGISLTGDYLGTLRTTTFRCNLGHEWLARPNSVTNGTGCIICSGKKLTKEIVNEKLIGRNVFLSGPFTKTSAKSIFQCHKGHQWEATPNMVLSGNGCPHCSNRVLLTKTEINKKLKHKGIVLIGDYLGANTKTLFRCSQNHEWEAVPTSVVYRTSCRICANRSPIHAEFKFQQLARTLRYEIISSYTAAKEKVSMKCPIGHLFEMTPYGFVGSGTRCPTCTKWGFDSSKPTTFYLFELSKDGLSGIGFGITNVFKARCKFHKYTFKKTNTRAILIKYHEFPNGDIPRKIESELKRHPSIINFGIEGFRTECLPIEYKQFLLDIISDWY